MTLAVIDLDLLAEKVAASTSRIPISLKYLTIDDLADMLQMPPADDSRRYCHQAGLSISDRALGAQKPVRRAD